MLKNIVTRCIALAFAVAAMVGIAEARSLDDIIKEGTIRIGINPELSPMSSRNDAGEWEGFDIDVGNKLAEALNVDGRMGADRDRAARAVPGRRQDRHLARRADPQRRARQAHRLHRAAAHRGAGGADHRQGDGRATGRTSTTRGITLANMRGNWTVDWIKAELPNVKMELVDSIADTVRVVAQGRADAIVENIDFFMALHQELPGREVARRCPTRSTSPSARSACSRATTACARCSTSSSSTCTHSGVNQRAWEKAYGAPMLRQIEPNPYF